MTEGKANASNWTERLGRSVQIGAILVASLGVAFGILLLINSQAIVGNTHARNAHDLEVVADIVEGWPRVYAKAAELRYGKAAPPISHPDLGPIEIKYDPNCAPPGSLFPAGTRPGEGRQFVAFGSFGPPTAKVCYQTQVSIGRLVGLERTAPNLSNVIIVGQDKAVLAQIGPSTLPITKLPPLTAANAFAKDLAANVTRQQAKPDVEVALESTGGAARTRLSDRDYFAYIQPIRVAAPRSLCPSAPQAATKAGSAPTKPGAAAPTAQAAPQPAPSVVEPCQLYAIGLMPTETLRRTWLQPPPLILFGFGLALLLALALLPATRLLLIGSAESVSAVEVAAIVFGVYAATSVATLAVIFSYELAGERRLALDEARASASRLAAVTRVELAALREGAIACGQRNVWTGDAQFYDAGELTEDGAPLRPGAKLRCSKNPLPAGADVSARQYFKDLRQKGDLNPGGSSGTEVQFGQVIAQTDGINKTVVALKWPDPDLRTGAAAATVADPATPPQTPTHRYFLAATVLRGLLAPILPPPQRFMVVDTSSDELPVLFHQNGARAGIEKLADQLQGSGPIVSALRRLPHADETGRQVDFLRRYDGEITQFSAAGVGGSNWVVLVYHRVDEVDAIAAQSAGRALFGWASITLPAMFIGGGLLLWRRDGWRYLWPFRDAADIYKRTYPKLYAAALAVAAIGWTSEVVGPPLAVLLATGGALMVFRQLRSRQLNAKPLEIEHERDYRRFVLAMITFVGIAPMIAFWADARSLSRDLVDAERREVVERAVTDRSQRIRALSDVPSIRATSENPFNPWDAKTASGTMKPVHQAGFSQLMLEWQTSLPSAPLYHCRIEGDAKAWYCWPRSGAPKGLEAAVTARPWAFPTGVPELAVIVVIAIVLGVLIYCVVYSGLRSLTGFGIPIGAVTWPQLVIGRRPNPKENELALASRSLLVAPQQAVRDRICNLPGALAVNIADALLPAPDSAFSAPDETLLARLPAWTPVDGKPRWLVVSGLELVLRDPKRRRMALNYLEQASRTVSRGAPKLAGLVIIAEMSPLERILDAFDVFGKAAASAPPPAPVSESDLREELRWARLFQDFTTFNFEPIDKVSPEHLERARTHENPNVQVLVDELRWLPGNVIDAVVATEAPAGVKIDNDDRYPLTKDIYERLYSERIVSWSERIKPITMEAAVECVRANLIEHYEQCWAASSMAERVILDAIARNSYVNMRKAVALQSLVRRGLVIMDRTPRLMNRSFALYIRQTERPDTLANWRRQLPRSPWALARLPLAIMLPVLVIGLAMAAAESGQELTALFSLLAAGMPALVGTFVRSARGA